MRIGAYFRWRKLKANVVPGSLSTGDVPKTRVIDLIFVNRDAAEWAPDHLALKTVTVD